MLHVLPVLRVTISCAWLVHALLCLTWKLAPCLLPSARSRAAAAARLGPHLKVCSSYISGLMVSFLRFMSKVSKAVLVRSGTEAARSDRLLACVRHGGTAFMHSECQPCKHGSSVVSTATLTSLTRHREHVIQSLGRWGGLGGSMTFETALATASIKVMKPSAGLWPPDNKLCHHGTSSHTCLGCFSVSVHSELCFQRRISFWQGWVRVLCRPRTSTAKRCVKRVARVAHLVCVVRAARAVRAARVAQLTPIHFRQVSILVSPGPELHPVPSWPASCRLAAPPDTRSQREQHFPRVRAKGPSTQLHFCTRFQGLEAGSRHACPARMCRRI